MCVFSLFTHTTDMGRLMARYCVAYESMKKFLSFQGKESLADLVIKNK